MLEEGCRVAPLSQAGTASGYSAELHSPGADHGIESDTATARPMVSLLGSRAAEFK
jgi:hypothetical protein